MYSELDIIDISAGRRCQADHRGEQTEHEPDPSVLFALTRQLSTRDDQAVPASALALVHLIHRAVMFASAATVELHDMPFADGGGRHLASQEAARTHQVTHVCCEDGASQGGGTQ